MDPILPKSAGGVLEYSKMSADSGGLEYSRIYVNYKGEEDSPPPLPASMTGVLKKRHGDALSGLQNDFLEY
jgi:hypothetical protein